MEPESSKVIKNQNIWDNLTLTELNNKCICEMVEDGNHELLVCMYCFIEENQRIQGNSNNPSKCRFNFKDKQK